MANTIRMSADEHGSDLLEVSTHYLHRVLGRDPQVVRCQPEPERARLIAIGHDGSYRDSSLTRYPDVGRRFLIAHSNLDIAGCQCLHDRVGPWVFFEFSPYGAAVAVKYRRMDHSERRHGHVLRGGQQTRQVTIDFELQLGQLVG